MKYKLLKDLPWAQVGTIYLEGIAHYYMESGGANGLLAKHDVEPFTDWFEPIDERWKPEQGDRYYYVYSEGVYTDRYGIDKNRDREKWEAGNCFKTAEQAEEAAKLIKQALLDLHKEQAGC